MFYILRDSCWYVLSCNINTEKVFKCTNSNSKIIPESNRTAVMNIVRIPLNLIVVAMLKYVKHFGFAFYCLTAVGFILAGNFRSRKVAKNE
jgi:hypothetical protein